MLIARTSAGGGPASSVTVVDDETSIGGARRAVVALAEPTMLDETERGALAIVVTEAATNLARHTKGGLIIARRLAGNVTEADGVEVISIDSGPGMSNVAFFLRDGESTLGTSGAGLGGMKRMSHEFDVFSIAGAGTVLVARVWSAAARKVRATANIDIGTVCVPLAGNVACGDAWAVVNDGKRTMVCVADGLGHGVEAAIASDAAIAVFRENVNRSPAEIIGIAHGAMRASRGAALSIAELDLATHSVRFAGIGNVAGAILAANGSTRMMVSVPGIVGHQIHKIAEFTYPWPFGTKVMMCTDGLTTRWNMQNYLGIASHHPSILAASMWRDYSRGRDDATVVSVGSVRKQEQA